MTTRRRARLLTAAVSTLSLAGLARAAEVPADAWPRFRGPAGTGEVKAGDVPTTWTPQKVVWRTELKGSGHSSPVVWGEKVFVTSAVDNGRQRLVVALDRATGKVLWEQVAWTGNAEKSHKMNGWATPTCFTDGRHVWAFFGLGGAYCYTVDGKKVWSRDLGTFRSKTERGVAASPVVVGDVVVINGDSESDPYLFGLNKLTGEVVWKADRPKDEGYSTPVLLTVNGRQEMVLNGSDFIAAYDPVTGKELWRCKSFAGRGEPLPAVWQDKLLLVVNGLAGDVYAVRPGGSGDVTKSHLAWHTPRKQGRDEPSPVVVGDLLLVSNMSSVLTAYDAATGKELWREPLSEGKTQVTAAPIAAGGKAYFVLENGETVVVEPTAKAMKVVARNTVNAADGEVFRGSPAAVGGQVFLRSDKAVYCVK
ncbi:MAG TPA: PQQ-binding-like beta-propeller repeat protein [Humisphaera sp.]